MFDIYSVIPDISQSENLQMLKFCIAIKTAFCNNKAFKI